MACAHITGRPGFHPLYAQETTKDRSTPWGPTHPTRGGTPYQWSVYSYTPLTSLGLISLSPEYMRVSENGGFSPQIIHFNRDFHYKPSIWGPPIFGNTHIENSVEIMGEFRPQPTFPTDFQHPIWLSTWFSCFSGRRPGSICPRPWLKSVEGPSPSAALALIASWQIGCFRWWKVVFSFLKMAAFLPSRELTYPTLGKGKSSSKCHFGGIC